MASAVTSSTRAPVCRSLNPPQSRRRPPHPPLVPSPKAPAAALVHSPSCVTLSEVTFFGGAVRPGVHGCPQFPSRGGVGQHARRELSEVKYQGASAPTGEGLGFPVSPLPGTSGPSEPVLSGRGHWGEDTKGRGSGGVPKIPYRGWGGAPSR